MDYFINIHNFPWMGKPSYQASDVFKSLEQAAANLMGNDRKGYVHTVQNINGVISQVSLTEGAIEKLACEYDYETDYDHICFCGQHTMYAPEPDVGIFYQQMGV